MPLINEIYANPEKYLESIPMLELDEIDNPDIFDASHDMWQSEIGRAVIASQRSQSAA